MNRKYYNADNGIVFVRNCTIPVKNIFKYNRNVIVNKRGRGCFLITYLFTEKSIAEADEVLKQTAGVIKFND